VGGFPVYLNRGGSRGIYKPVFNLVPRTFFSFKKEKKSWERGWPVLQNLLYGQGLDPLGPRTFAIFRGTNISSPLS